MAWRYQTGGAARISLRHSGRPRPRAGTPTTPSRGAGPTSTPSSTSSASCHGDGTALEPAHQVAAPAEPGADERTGKVESAEPRRGPAVVAAGPPACSRGSGRFVLGAEDVQI